MKRKQVLEFVSVHFASKGVFSSVDCVTGSSQLVITDKADAWIWKILAKTDTKQKEQEATLKYQKTLS